MYQRALQGYENVLGHEPVKIYISAPNMLENHAALCAQLRTSERGGEQAVKAAAAGRVSEM